MENQDIKQQIMELIEQIVKDNFMEIVDIEFISSSYLRIVIDKHGGVSIDDCSLISRNINAMLTALGYNFSLEVSSPGMDRPLKKIEDFKKFTGRRAKIITKEQINGTNVFEGKIDRVNNGTITINAEAGCLEIDFNNIKKANLIDEVKI